jgi:hypothetical protein
VKVGAAMAHELRKVGTAVRAFVDMVNQLPQTPSVSAPRFRSDAPTRLPQLLSSKSNG